MVTLGSPEGSNFGLFRGGGESGNETMLHGVSNKVHDMCGLGKVLSYLN